MTDQEPIFGPRQAISLDNMFEQSGMQGWEFLEKALDPKGAMRGELEAKAASVAPYAYAIAASREGKQFLEWLCDISVRRPTFIAGMNIEQAALYAANREGQAALVFTILKAIKAGQDRIEGKGAG